jgi:hypothetical protein
VARVDRLDSRLVATCDITTVPSDRSLSTGRVPRDVVPASPVWAIVGDKRCTDHRHGFQVCDPVVTMCDDDDPGYAGARTAASKRAGAVVLRLRRSVAVEFGGATGRVVAGRGVECEVATPKRRASCSCHSRRCDAAGRARRAELHPACTEHSCRHRYPGPRTSPALGRRPQLDLRRSTRQRAVPRAVPRGAGKSNGRRGLRSLRR